MSDVKLLPLPEETPPGPVMGTNGTGWEIYAHNGCGYDENDMEAFARACIEADRKARPDDGEAVSASFIRYMLGPFNDDTRTVHSLLADVVLIARGDADAKKAPPDDVARLVEAVTLEYCGEGTEASEPDDSKVSFPEEDCNITFGMIRRARAALGLPSFTSAQQEVQP